MASAHGLSLLRPPLCHECVRQTSWPKGISNFGVAPFPSPPGGQR